MKKLATIALLAGLACADMHEYHDEDFDQVERDRLIPGKWRDFIMSRTDKFKFLSFIAKMGKNYMNNDEFQRRAYEWKKSDGIIAKALRERNYEVDHNWMSDWSEEERTAINSLQTYIDDVEEGSGRRLQARGPSVAEVTKELMESIQPLDNEMRRQLAYKDCGSGKYYYAAWDWCRSCGSNCASCSSSTNCYSCTSSYYKVSGGSCVYNSGGGGGSSCRSGQYKDYWGDCKSCDSGCSSCQDDWGWCETCDYGYTLSGTSCVYSGSGGGGGGSCGSGKYRDYWGDCKSCGATCAACEDDWGTCTQCASGYELYGSSCYYTGNTGSSCGSDQYMDYWTDACKDCPTGCSACDDDWGDCTSCQYGYTLSGDKCVKSSVGCSSDQYKDWYGDCKDCGSGCASCSDYYGTCSRCESGYTMSGSSCVKSGGSGSCRSGQYADWSGSCQRCGNDCDECNDYTGSCKKCKHSSFEISGKNCQCPAGTTKLGGISCVADDNGSCSAGQYKDWYDQCANCGTNCAECSDLWGTCTKCTDPSMTLDGENCKGGGGGGSCPSGQYSNSWGSCSNCGSNCAACSDSYSCSSCDSGYKLSGGSCIAGSPHSGDRYHAAFSDSATSFDWRDVGGVVSAVRDQGQCGSCWAFMTMGAVESAYAIKTGTLYDLSEQHLVDCNYEQSQCYGGDPRVAMRFVGNNGAILESDYPYTSGRTGTHATCEQDYKTKQFYLDGSTRSSAYEFIQDWDTFLHHLRRQPVALAFEVSDEFQFYKSGIFDGPCHYELNHAMVAVGYGRSGGEEFVVIRNSYALRFGEQGYSRVTRGDKSRCTCGFCSYATVPIIA